jgi:uncharacterized damage-inducible protein DinB
MDAPVALLYPDWPQYADRLRAAVEPLTADQLALRAGPEHGTIWQLAAHVAGARVYWVCGVFGEPGVEQTPFEQALVDGTGWEDDEDHPRSGAELAWALDSTWAIVADCLARWPIDSLGETATRLFDDGRRQLHSRASVLNRLFSHDAFHGGEISQLLGLHELPPIDLWVRPATT